MVGDHHVRAPRLALALLDEAAAVVRARAVDALAAPVREPEGAAVAEQIGEPSGQVAAGQVAVPRRRRPTRHQAERDALRRHQRAAADRLLHVEQAEIVLAPLAQHHLLGLRLGLGVEAVQLLVDLALQVAREGGKPDRALVALGPEARRRDVAEGLADSGAGFRQHHVGLRLRLHRVECRACRGGVVGLLRPGLRAVAQQVREALARGPRGHRVVPRRCGRRALLPFLEPGPDGEGALVVGAARARRCAAAGLQRGDHRIAPGPAGARHRACDSRRVPGACETRRRRRVPGACEIGRRQRAEQASGRGVQGGRFVLRALGQREAERAREPAHRRHREPRRVHEGEELQHVERRERGEAEPADDRLRVADVGRRARRGQALARLPVGEPGEHAVLVQPDHVAWRHHQRRRARQRQRGRRKGGLAGLEGRRHRAGV